MSRCFCSLGLPGPRFLLSGSPLHLRTLSSCAYSKSGRRPTCRGKGWGQQVPPRLRTQGSSSLLTFHWQPLSLMFLSGHWGGWEMSSRHALHQHRRMESPTCKCSQMHNLKAIFHHHLQLIDNYLTSVCQPRLLVVLGSDFITFITLA